MEKPGYVYILTNAHHNVLYTGVTSHLTKRLYEHRTGVVRGFTAKFNVAKLVYYEEHPDIASAIAREKVIKRGTRARKVSMISRKNPCWKELLP